MDLEEMIRVSTFLGSWPELAVACLVEQSSPRDEQASRLAKFAETGKWDPTTPSTYLSRDQRRRLAIATDALVSIAYKDLSQLKQNGNLVAPKFSLPELTKENAVEIYNTLYGMLDVANEEEIQLAGEGNYLTLMAKLLPQRDALVAQGQDLRWAYALIRTGDREKMLMGTAMGDRSTNRPVIDWNSKDGKFQLFPERLWPEVVALYEVLVDQGVEILALREAEAAAKARMEKYRKERDAAKQQRDAFSLRASSLEHQLRHMSLEARSKEEKPADNGYSRLEKDLEASRRTVHSLESEKSALEQQVHSLEAATVKLSTDVKDVLAAMAWYHNRTLYLVGGRPSEAERLQSLLTVYGTKVVHVEAEKARRAQTGGADLIIIQARLLDHSSELAIREQAQAHIAVFRYGQPIHVFLYETAKRLQAPKGKL